MTVRNTPTWYLSRLNVFLWTRKQFTVDDYTTMNEKFQVQVGADIPSNQYPVPRYLAIGIGGHTTTIAVDGHPLVSEVYHRATDPVLFKHVPFIMRRVDNDLTPTQRSRYRIRRLETHGGIEYFVYYLRILESDFGNIENLLRITENGTSLDPITFTSSPSLLTPTPVSKDEIASASGQSLEVLSQASVSLDKDECAEILNAIRIIYNDDNYAVITEAAVAMGFDTTIVSNIGGITVNHTEAIAVQPALFLQCTNRISETTTGIDFSFNIGKSHRMPT